MGLGCSKVATKEDQGYATKAPANGQQSALGPNQVWTEQGIAEVQANGTAASQVDQSDLPPQGKNSQTCRYPNKSCITPKPGTKTSALQHTGHCWQYGKIHARGGQTETVQLWRIEVNAPEASCGAGVTRKDQKRQRIQAREQLEQARRAIVVQKHLERKQQERDHLTAVLEAAQSTEFIPPQEEPEEYEEPAPPTPRARSPSPQVSFDAALRAARDPSLARSRTPSPLRGRMAVSDAHAMPPPAGYAQDPRNYASPLRGRAAESTPQPSRGRGEPSLQTSLRLPASCAWIDRTQKLPAAATGSPGPQVAASPAVAYAQDPRNYASPLRGRVTESSPQPNRGRGGHPGTLAACFAQLAFWKK